MLRFLTAGESHGKCLVAILEGMAAGLKVDKNYIDKELFRRQAGYGRGPRMKIEKDKVEILSGLRKGITLGSPVSLLIKNKDFSIDKLSPVFSPRPGHADLAGILKYGFTDGRDVLERASSRETAARVAVGAVCKIFLDELGIEISSRVLLIGGQTKRDLIQKKIQEAIKRKDTVGGIFEIVAKGVPVGLGSYAQYDRRLSASLTAAVMSIPGIKAVEIGLGAGYAYKFGSECHDAIYYGKSGFYRRTNNAGGLEGGITNGEDLVIRACMKPIATLGKPLASVNIRTKKPALASIQRSDICVVESAGVIAENMLAFELAKAFMEKFGSDSLAEIRRNYTGYLKAIRG